MKFDSILNSQVDMSRVHLDSMKPWISKRITEILDHEDDVVINYVYNQLEPQYPDPKEIQSNLSGFFSLKNARMFLADLWKKLLDSMSEVHNGKIVKPVNDKIRDISKAVMPDNFKLFDNGKPRERRSEGKENNQRYRRHSSVSSGSSTTESSSSEFTSSSSESRNSRRRHSQFRTLRSRYSSISPVSMRLRGRLSRYSYSRSRHSYSRYSKIKRSRYSRSRHSMSRYNRRRRSRSISYQDRRQPHRYSSKYNHDIHNHSRHHSSTGHTPYTRYSDYTDDKNYINLVSDNNLSSEESSDSPSSETSSSSLRSNKVVLPVENVHVTTCEKNNPFLNSIKYASSKSNDIDEFEYIEESSEMNLPKSSESLVENESNKSLTIMSISHVNIDLVEMSKSPPCHKPTDTSSESSSSTDYTVEYVEKSQILKSEETSEDSVESFASSSDLEWLTMEEYQQLHNSSDNMSSTKSLSSCSYSCSSKFSLDEVVWIEGDQWDSYSEQFYRL